VLVQADFPLSSGSGICYSRRAIRQLRKGRRRNTVFLGKSGGLITGPPTPPSGPWASKLSWVSAIDPMFAVHCARGGFTANTL
jgi:hypothetical protein